jgi:hypothetical protein
MLTRLVVVIKFVNFRFALFTPPLGDFHLRMAQQCQPSTSVTGRSAAGEGTTIDMAKSGPAVMAEAGGRKQQSNHLQAHVPS